MTEQPQPQIQPEPQQPAPVVYQPQPMLEADARLWAMLINLAAVLGIILSGGTLSLIAVVVIWLMYRERSALVDFHGKQQLNLMITVLLAAVAAVLFGIFTLTIGFLLLIIPAIAYGIYILVISIVAAVAANRGEYYRIPLIVTFIK